MRRWTQVGTALATVALGAAMVWAWGAGAQVRRARQPAAPGELVHLTLLGINDLHGALDGTVVGEGEAGGPGLAGGAALMGAYVAAVRAANPDGTVVVDAGDMLQGPLLCNHFEGAPVADVYRYLGVVASALGNHEFDYGPVGERSRPRDGDDPRGALDAFQRRAGFPILAANVHAEAGGVPLPEGIVPHTVVEAAGVRIGIIGLSTHETPNVTVRENVPDLVFDRVAEVLPGAVEAVREEGATVVVVLAHLDGSCGDRSWPPPEICEPRDELAELLGATAGGVDAVFVGHRHAWFANLIDGVAVVESGSYGRALSRVDLWVDPATGRAERARTRVSRVDLCQLQPAEGSSCLDPRAAGPWTPARYEGVIVEPDPRIEEILAPYRDEVAVLCRDTLATAARTIGRGRDGETAAGNLVTDAMRFAVDGADVAVCNSGGIRADLPPGPITFCEVYALMPFDSVIVEVRMTGDELREFMRIGTSGAHSVLQVSGLRLAVSGGEGTGEDRDHDGEVAGWERDRLASITTDDGAALEPGRTYRVLMPDYVYGRPDDMQHLLGSIPQDRVTRHPMKVRDALAAFLPTVDVVLGDGGGWPLPQEDDPRIEVRSD